EVFLNKKFNKDIRQDTISEWRRTVRGDLTAAFTQYNGEERKDIPFLDRNPYLGSVHNAQSKKETTNYRKLTAGEIDQFNKDPYSFMARQEEGKRPASPLPYELYGDGGLSEDGSGFEIRMEAG